MGLVASISVKFHPAPLVSQSLAVLRAAGWQPWSEAVEYEHFRDVSDSGDYRRAAPAEWQSVCALLDSKYSEGDTVATRLGYHGAEVDVWFSFWPGEDGGQEMHAALGDARPRLCGRFTDYGWYLPRIVCPLHAARYNILEVTCNDDNY